jgi:hypothetical protein
MGFGPKDHTVPLARGMEAQQNPAHALGKLGKPKGYDVHIHDGMRSVNRNTGTHEWGGVGASFDANPANPLNSGPARGKRLTPVQPVPGQRSRANDPLASGEPGQAHADAMLNRDQLLRDSQQVSAKVLAEAGDNSAPDDRRALGIGTLPEATTEE